MAMKKLNMWEIETETRPKLEREKKIEREGGLVARQKHKRGLPSVRFTEWPLRDLLYFCP